MFNKIKGIWLHRAFCLALLAFLVGLLGKFSFYLVCVADILWKSFSLFVGLSFVSLGRDLLKASGFIIDSASKAAEAKYKQYVTKLEEQKLALSENLLSAIEKFLEITKILFGFQNGITGIWLRCLVLAAFYPFLFLFISYLSDNKGDLVVMGAHLLPQQEDLLLRLNLLTLATLIIWVPAFLICRRMYKKAFHSKRSALLEILFWAPAISIAAGAVAFILSIGFWETSPARMKPPISALGVSHISPQTNRSTRNGRLLSSNTPHNSDTLYP